MNKPAIATNAIVLAAGQGTRMKSSRALDPPGPSP